MPGIISGALGGAGDAMVKFGLQQQNAANAMDLENLRDQNAQNRAIALEKARIELGNQQREAGVNRVNQAQAGLVQEAQVGKLNKFYGEGSNLTAADVAPEELSSPDAQLSQGEKDDLRTRAAISTGDISPKDAALIGTREATNEARMQIAQLRNDAFMARTEAQYEVAMAKLREAMAKAGGKDQTNKEMLSLLDGMRKDIASESADVKNSMKAEIQGLGKFAEPDEVKKVTDAYAPKLQALTKRRKQIQQDFNALRTRLGLPAIQDEETGNDLPGSVPSGAPAPSTSNRPPLSSFQK